MIQIRLLNESDAAAWRELRLRGLELDSSPFKQTYEEALAQPIEEVIAGFSPAACETSPRFGAFHDGVLVGICGLAREARLKVRHKAMLWGMFVAPEARGLGVGGKLVEAVVAQARAMPDLLQVNLTVVSTNESARRLYRRHGFEVQGREVRALRHEGVDYDEELMVLFLDDRGPPSSG